MADKLHFKKETLGRYVLKVLLSLGLFFLAILFALWIPLIYLGLSINEEDINALAIYSVILALIALAITILLETKSEKILTILNSEISSLNENIHKIDQDTQQIITQINHLEESQEITERLDWIAVLPEQMATQSDRNQEIVMQLDRIAVALEQMITQFDRNQEIIERLNRIEIHLNNRFSPQPRLEDDVTDNPTHN